MTAKRLDPMGLRSQRIKKMHTMIVNAGDVDLKRFTATCSYTMGLTRARVREYLLVLEDLGHIEVDEIAGVIKEVKSGE